MKYTKMLSALAITVGLSAGLQAAQAASADNGLFQLSEVSNNGALIAEGKEHKCGKDHKCGKEKGHKCGKDHKCGKEKGEHKCGKDHKDGADKCGADKCGTEKKN